MEALCRYVSGGMAALVALFAPVVPLIGCVTGFILFDFITGVMASHHEARRRGYQSTMSATCFWLWNVLGSLIIVGPFIYWYKFFKAMNQINTSYNMYG